MTSHVSKTAKRRAASADSGAKPGVHPPGVDPRVRRIEEVMRCNLHRTLCLGELARESALSVSRLAHLFKAHTGLAPGRYLKLVRLYKAQDLLEDSPLSVKEIAARVGLDPSRLAKEFRTNYGVTPGDFRRALHFRQQHSGKVYHFPRGTQTPRLNGKTIGIEIAGFV